MWEWESLKLRRSFEVSSPSLVFSGGYWYKYSVGVCWGGRLSVNDLSALVVFITIKKYNGRQKGMTEIKTKTVENTCRTERLTMK